MVALVRCNVSDMSQNENDNNQTDYVCTFFMDSKVQEKLLEVDESFLWEDCLQCNATNTNNSAKQDKSFKFDIRCAELTGWCNKSRVNFRKAEKDSKPHPKDLTKLETREDYFGYHYKETRPKRPESFKFRHFSDLKKYILQYRSDHACSSSSTVKTPPSLYNYMEPDIKRAFHSRLSAHTPSNNEKTNRLPDATQTHNGVPTNACLHYTTRKDTKPALHELAYKYKLAPNIVLLNENNSNSPEHEKVTLQMRSHSASAKSPRIYSGKLPQSKLSSKMPAPFGQSHVNSKPPSLQTLTVSGHSSPKPGDMAAMRTVDQLSCITTGDRQTENIDSTSEDLVEIEDSCKANVDNCSSNVSLIEDINSSSSQSCKHPISKTHSVELPFVPIKSNMVSADILPSAMKTGCPSDKHRQKQNVDIDETVMRNKSVTTCHSLEAKVKSVDPTCTYHFFPNKEMLVPVWNPATSSPGVGVADLCGNEADLTGDAKKQKETMKIRLSVTRGTESQKKKSPSNEKDIFRGNNSEEVAQNLFKDENEIRETKPKLSKGVCASRSKVLRSSAANNSTDELVISSMSQETTNGEKRQLKCSYQGHDQQSSKCEKPHKSPGFLLRPYSDDAEKQKQHLPAPMPFLKFWGNSVPQKALAFVSKKDSFDSRTDKKSSNREVRESQKWQDRKPVQEMKDENFIQMEAAYCSYRGKLEQVKALLRDGPAIANGEAEDPDDKLQRRLELLRTINKPSTRDKQKLTKLMFLRDDGNPVSVDEMSQKLCDQRRLKHFLEQAKLKNFKPTTSFFTLPTKSSLQHNLAKTSSFHRSGVIQDVTSPRSSISSISDCDVFENNIQTTDMSNHAPYQDVCEEDSEWKKFTQNAPVQLITHAD